MDGAAVKALNCPHCGAPLTLHGSGQATTVVCGACHSILDTRDENVQILRQFEARRDLEPLIPLGTRGKFHGAVYEVIGFQVRLAIMPSGPWEWAEYVLFNPFYGFRYLAEYSGHWNDVAVLRSLPEVSSAGAVTTATFLGQRFPLLQLATAETLFVLGEFPWQAHAGEQITVTNYVSPPRMLTCETTETETVWSLGEYISGQRVWSSFGLAGEPPAPQGAFPAQPSPYRGGVREMWIVCCLLLAALAGIAWAFIASSRQEEVYRGRFTLAEDSAVASFELAGDPANVEITVRTSLRNTWAYLRFELVNTRTGERQDFGRQLSQYYHWVGGRPGGRPNDRVVLSPLPAGPYALRMTPELVPKRASVRYDLTVRQDVPDLELFFLAALLLLIPPVLATFRSIGFERARSQ